MAKGVDQLFESGQSLYHRRTGSGIEGVSHSADPITLYLYFQRSYIFTGMAVFSPGHVTYRGETLSFGIKCRRSSGRGVQKVLPQPQAVNVVCLHGYRAGYHGCAQRTKTAAQERILVS